MDFGPGLVIVTAIGAHVVGLEPLADACFTEEAVAVGAVLWVQDHMHADLANEIIVERLFDGGVWTEHGVENLAFKLSKDFVDALVSLGLGLDPVQNIQLALLVSPILEDVLRVQLNFVHVLFYPIGCRQFMCSGLWHSDFCETDLPF